MMTMALDHTRLYFHLGSFTNDPTDLETTTPALFMTRFITHFCAPVFIFLTGTSASLYGQNKPKKTLSKFLFTRGLWLIFVEIIIMNFLWWFNPAYPFINLQVIWAIGLSMVFLSFLIYLPKKLLILISLIIVFGHNLLDNIHVEGDSFTSMLWYMFHQLKFPPEGRIIFYYPVLPWIAVMALGYCFGSMFHKGFDPIKRKKVLIMLGLSTIFLFVLIRSINIYGDMQPWSQQKDLLFTFFSFMNVSKYPPSLLYILITIGPTFLVLYLLEGLKTKATDFLLVFGRVPFFYYLMHIFLIHSAALITLLLLQKDWTLMIFDMTSITTNKLADYGYSLGVVYVVWILIVLLLYPMCYKYMRYKLEHPQKWWLSYL